MDTKTLSEGLRFGAYRVLDELGEGGMGKVFRAHDDRLGREVAVKVVRAERRMDGRAAARFRREAQLLSRLEHPNISRVYELVEFEDDDLLVMELVRGRTLRQVIDEGVDRARAVDIILQTARALEAAHAMSIVHRDLKPENIMIAEDGQVRVLDFGLARTFDTPEIDDEDEVDSPVGITRTAPQSMTRTGDILGTPRYMSPEQARTEVVTAAGDLYSLGLILQETLSGEPPYSEDVAGPQLLRRAMWGDVNRSESIRGPLHSLIDDLLELEPTNRPTAGEVARQLNRVQETPRRRLLLAAAVAVGVSVILALTATTVGYLRTQKALAVEFEAGKQSAAVNRVLSNILASGNPYNRGADVKVSEVLDDGVRLIERGELREYPLAEAAALAAIGRSYGGLGLSEQSLPCLERAFEIRLEHAGADNRETLLNMIDLAWVLESVDRTDEAEELVREAHERAQAVFARDDIERWMIQNQLADLHIRSARYDEAEELLIEASAEADGLNMVKGFDTFKITRSLANLYWYTDRQEEALALEREIADRARETLGEHHPETLTSRSRLANGLRMAGGHEDEAEEIMLEVIAGQREALGDRHSATLTSLWNIGVIYKKQGRWPEAETALREVLDTRRAVFGSNHSSVASALNSLGPILGRQGKYEEAEAMLREAVAINEAANGPEHPNTIDCVCNLANLCEAKGDRAEAVRLFQTALEQSRSSRGLAHRKTVRIAESLANNLAKAQRRDEAVQVLQEFLNELHRNDDATQRDIERLEAQLTELTTNRT